MKSIVLVFNCCFETVVDSGWVNDGMDPHGPVNVLLTYPPYTTRSAKYRANSEYHSMKTNEIVGVVELAANVMAPEGHGHMFCSALQFPHWVTLLDQNT